jgi:hypothetical protein
MGAADIKRLRANSASAMAADSGSVEHNSQLMIPSQEIITIIIMEWKSTKHLLSHRKISMPVKISNKE